MEKYMRKRHTLEVAVGRVAQSIRNSREFRLLQKLGMEDRTLGEFDNR